MCSDCEYYENNDHVLIIKSEKQEIDDKIKNNGTMNKKELKKQLNI